MECQPWHTILTLINRCFCFSLLWETIFLRFHTCSPGSIIPYIGLLDLPEESSFWRIFNKKLPHWQLPTGAFDLPFWLNLSADGSSNILCFAPTAQRNGPTKGPLNSCLTPQTTGFRCAGCNHAEKQTIQTGICSASTVLAQCRVGLHCFSRWGHSELEETEDWEHVNRGLLGQI